MSQPGKDQIKAERMRQIGIGYKPKNDMGREDELAAAADCYLFLAHDQVHGSGLVVTTDPPERWPWSAPKWKPSPAPLRNLVRAGALFDAAADVGIEAVDRDHYADCRDATAVAIDRLMERSNA